MGSTDGAFINRIGSDGNILGLRKDGTTVGSIGAIFGDVYIDSAGAQSGLRFEANDITPRRNSAEDTSGLISLGNSSKRFKDLYLAGNVVIGTSGKGIDFSANGNAAGMTSEVLDDYEYGEFTPVIGDGTYTSSLVEGRYSKVGNMVTIHIGFRLSSASSLGTATASISGLPFTASSSGGYQEPHQHAPNGNMVTSVPSLSFYVSGTTLYARNSGTNGDSPISSVNLWTASSFIKYQLTYWV